VQFEAADAGLTTTLSRDIWGASSNLLHYLKPTTLRVHANGYAVHTTRAGLQQVVNEFTTFYQDLLTGYQARDLYPVASCFEVRVTGTDQAVDVGIPGARPPALSPTRRTPTTPSGTRWYGWTS
jgi:hypothetical protein